MKRLTAILLSAACLSGFLALGTTAASAQDKYPSRTVKILVPYAPGGATPEADVLFFTVKDASHSLHGIKAT